MKKADLLSTLFVGIDISSRENVVAVMDFESNKPIASFTVPKNELMLFHTEMYCLNLKSIANYKKSYIGLRKKDYIDVFIITDFASVCRITTKPWRGCQYLALQRLTRHRLHLVKALTKEYGFCTA